MPLVSGTRIDKEAGWWALKNMRNDHLGSLAIGDVHLPEEADKQSLLFARAPDETRDHAGPDEEEGGPAAKGLIIPQIAT